MALSLSLALAMADGGRGRMELERCDPEGSRRVRRAVTEALTPPGGLGSFPGDCLLHVDRDVWKTFEQKKLKKRRTRWTCGFCGKQFRGEKYLDLHMANRHAGEARPEADVCLADLYDVLHVDAFERAMAYDRKGERWRQENVVCRPREVQKRKEGCEALAQQCYPPETSRELNLMHHRFLEEVCTFHACGVPGKPYATLAPTHAAARVMKTIGLMATLLGVLVFYGLVFVERWQARIPGDLRRVTARNRTRSQRLRRWMWAQLPLALRRKHKPA